MVAGIDRFREHFAAHEDQYAIIGGAACDLLFGSAGLEPASVATGQESSTVSIVPQTEATPT